MFRITLGMIPAIAVALAVGAMALLAQPSTVEAQTPSANRSFRANWVPPGAEFRVDVSVRNYGPFGQACGNAARRLHVRALQPRENRG